METLDLKSKTISFKAGPKNYTVTTHRWKQPNATENSVNVEKFQNHYLGIPEDEEIADGHEITNVKRIEYLRAAIVRDKKAARNFCHEFDLEAEAAGILGRDKEIAALRKQLRESERTNEILKGKNPAQVSRAGGG